MGNAPADRILRPGENRFLIVSILVLGIAAILLRAPQLGNPLLDIDEQFYLLMGDRMLHGALPYVDIWDRKPIGLFLLYAAIRLLGGDGVLQYQLVATLFALTTAVLITLIARRMTNSIGAVLGGIIYLVWLELLGGTGGQSPVFYNLFTAVAAWLTLRAVETPSRDNVIRSGALAMLTMGIALQIKPSAVFEGCAFGLVLLYLGFRSDHRLVAVLRLGLLLIGTALLPTLLALAYYAAMGAGSAYWFANITSILLRTAPQHAHWGASLGGLAIVLLPPATAAIAGLISLRKRADPRFGFFASWLLAAFIGFLAVPPYYNHYALPLVLPLCIAGAVGLGLGRIGQIAAITMAVMMLRLAGYPDFNTTVEARKTLAALTAVTAKHLDGGCLFVFQGPPILYQTTQSCLVTPYIFPAHLNYQGEAKAIGVDPEMETRRLLARHPNVIVTSSRRVIADANPRTWPIVEAALRRDYRLVGTAFVDLRILGVYARKHD